MSTADIEHEYTYYIGIDFGTTYSGCCYAKSGNPDAVYSIKQWPRTSTLDEKVPSVIAYSGINRVPSQIAYSVSQNSSINENMNSTEKQQVFISIDSKIIGIGHVPQAPNSIHIKHLPNKLNLSELVPDDSQRTPAVDFLRLFHQHVIQEIKKRHGEKDLLKLRYCFTLQYPSEPVYRKNLLTATKLAGIYSDNDREDKILFIDTYLAMAKHILKSKDLNLDETFIICDADSKYTKIKVMKVISIGRDVDVKESPYGITHDELCSDQLDALFQTYIQTMIKKHPVRTEENHVKMVKTAMDYFKSDMKYSLEIDDEDPVYIDILTSQSPAPYLTLQMEDIKLHVYDPILDRIFDSVSKLYKTTSANHIYLCGTLSRLPYVIQRFEEITNSLDVLPNDDLSAAQGAVYLAQHEKLASVRTAPICIPEACTIVADKVMSDPSDFKYTHIIGIDFGTSFSKWYYTTLDGKVQPLFEKDLMLIPTLSLYDEGLRRQKLWGRDAFVDYYKSGESGKLMTRFKLHLDSADKDEVDELIVINAISNYLRSLHMKIMETMDSLFPGDIKKYKYCLTVPTIWSDRMKRIMRETAISAGIISMQDYPGRLTLVNEPEAAAVFYANDPTTDFIGQHFKKNPLLKKARTLVCDAGGGTVDMATFDYFKSVDSSKYFLDEVTMGTGSLCGSSFLDDLFRKLIVSRCDAANYDVSRYNIEQIVLHFIQNVKESYTYTDKKDITFAIPEQTNEVVLSSNDLSSIVFDPIITQVINLIKKQMEETELDMIIITGGLGQSTYLLDKVNELVKGRNIDVHSPKAYDQSVVRGAVDFVRDPNYIRKRIVQKSYGIEVLVPIDPKLEEYYYEPQAGLPNFMGARFDSLCAANKPIKANEYVQKIYYVAYPNNAYIALLSHHGEITGIESSLDRRLEKVLTYNVDMPQSTFLRKGDIIPIIVKLYLGQTEIKVDVTIDQKNARKWAKIKKRQGTKKDPPPIKPNVSTTRKSESSKLGRSSSDPSKKIKPQKGFLGIKWPST